MEKEDEIVITEKTDGAVYGFWISGAILAIIFAIILFFILSSVGGQIYYFFKGMGKTYSTIDDKGNVIYFNDPSAFTYETF